MVVGHLVTQFQGRYYALSPIIGCADMPRGAAMSLLPLRLSQTLRGTEPSISALCLGFVGRRLAEKLFCRMFQY